MIKDTPRAGDRPERENGRALKDRGVFEFDTSSGSVEWANDFALEVIGCLLRDLSSMSVFDLSPERFHERIRADVAEEPTGDSRRPYILPTRTMDGKIAWWYVFRTHDKAAIRWAYAEHIGNTPQSGPEFSFMAVQAETVSNQASLEDRLDDLDEWIKGQFSRVDGEIGSLRSNISGLSTAIERAEGASRTASSEAVAAKNASLAVQSELKRYSTKEDMEQYFDRFDRFEEESSRATTEILRLIRTDTAQEGRLRAYEAYVKRTTETAVRAIEAQASKSGKGLSRKVTVPIFVVTTLAMLFQYLIQHWGAIRALLPH